MILNLPVNLSERQYRSLAMAKQVKLNAEKDSMIRQNNKMDMNINLVFCEFSASCKEI